MSSSWDTPDFLCVGARACGEGAPTRAPSGRYAMAPRAGPSLLSMLGDSDDSGDSDYSPPLRRRRLGGDAPRACVVGAAALRARDERDGDGAEYESSVGGSDGPGWSPKPARGRACLRRGTPPARAAPESSAGESSAEENSSESYESDGSEEQYAPSPRRRPRGAPASQRAVAKDARRDGAPAATAAAMHRLVASAEHVRATLGAGDATHHLRDVVLEDFQSEGLAWVKSAYLRGVNTILADEMGLGKTVQSLAMLSCVLEWTGGPVLVVCPKAVLGNWTDSLERWSTMPFVRYQGDRDTLYALHGRIRRGNLVVVATYESVERLVECPGVEWKYAVFDEAHRLKRFDSKLKPCLRQICRGTCGKLLLTGTPLQNNMGELYALLHLLHERMFPATLFEPFTEYFSDTSDDARVEMLRTILRTFLLQRRKADVNIVLPPKHRFTVFTSLTAAQRELYAELVATGAHPQKLLSCCDHADLAVDRRRLAVPTDDAGLAERSGKLQLLHAMLARTRARGGAALLFSQYTGALDIIHDSLRHAGFRVCGPFDGATETDDRMALIDAFQDARNAFDIFLISTRAGNAGITLTRADTVFLYDSSWNPFCDLQAEARCHRIGQTKEVRVYRFETAMPGGGRTIEAHVRNTSRPKVESEQVLLVGDGARRQSAPPALLADECAVDLDMLMDPDRVHARGPGFELEESYI